MNAEGIWKTTVLLVLVKIRTYTVLKRSKELEHPFRNRFSDNFDLSVLNCYEGAWHKSCF